MPLSSESPATSAHSGTLVYYGRVYNHQLSTYNRGMIRHKYNSLVDRLYALGWFFRFLFSRAFGRLLDVAEDFANAEMRRLDVYHQVTESRRQHERSDHPRLTRAFGGTLFKPR